MNHWPSLIWHMPGRVWAGMLRAAPMPLWWRAGAAVVLTGIFAGVIAIFWRAKFWPPEAWELRGNWLGYMGLSAAFTLLISIVALMDLRLNFRASRTGIEANMAGDDEAPLPPLTVTPATTVEAPPAPEKP